MPILDLLCFPPPRNPQTVLPAGENYSVALIGSGGKTTLMSLLSRILPTYGYGVVTTTTTHIFPPNDASLSPLRSDALVLTDNLGGSTLVDSLADFFRLTPCGHITVGQGISANGKLRGLAPDHICQTMTQMCDKMSDLRKNSICWLIEADGSAGLPLKAHATHEPVIPACAHEIIMLAGLDALGQPLRDVVHRWELAVERLSSFSDSIIPETILTPSLMTQILLAEMPSTSIPLTLILNKEDCLTSPSHSISSILSLFPPALPCYAAELARQRVHRL